MTLPELSVRRPIATLMVLVSIAVIGFIAITRLPLAFMPKFEEPQVWVMVEYPGASPTTIERNVVRPLEETLGSVKGLEHMWSTCDSRGARISLNLRWGTNLGLARLEVRDKIDRMRGELPSGVERIHVSGDWDPKESGETILEARLASGRDLSRDYDLLDRKIIRPLRRIPGVAQVLLDGVSPREVRVNLDLAALERHGVDPRTVLRVLRENNEDRSLGVLRGDEQVVMLRAVGAFRDVDQVRNLVVGPGLRLADVAGVTYQEPPLEYGRHLDGKFAVGVSVAKEANANTVEITDEIRRRVAAMDSDPELAGIKFLVWEDQGKEIRHTIDDLRNTGIIGAILASAVLYLFLRRVGTTLVAVACIPFSLIVACGVVWARGGTLNTLTLLGLIVGIGMLVDNAVVVIENIDRQQARGLGRRAAALVGAREVSVAVIAATATSVIVFLPMIFSQPSEINILLRELGLTVCYTLVASLFISQTLIPLAAASVLRPGRSEPGRYMAWLQRHYERLLRFTLAHRWLAPVIGLVVVASAVYPFQKIEKNFDTKKAEMFVAIRYVMEDNPSLARKEALVTQVERLLEPFREELKIGSVYSFWSDRWTMTRLYMEEGHTTEEAMAHLRRRLREVVPQFAGMRLEVQDNSQFWQRNRGKRVGFKLEGEDSEVLGRLADEARQRLEKVPGLLDVYATAQKGSQEIHAAIDRDRAREYGVPVEQPGNVIELSFRGRRLPRFKGVDGEVEMRLTLDEDRVTSLGQLAQLPLLRADGSTVPLASVATIAKVPVPDDIQRDNRVTGVWVGGRFDEGTREDMQTAGRKAVEDMELPFGYRWDFQAQDLDQEESQREFVTNLMLALGLILAVMAGLFESVRQAISLFVALPFAIAGAVWSLYVTGTDFDQPASVGLLLLLGIVVNNGIVMLEHINYYRRRGMAREQAMLTGGRERLRPIVMTAVTTLLGLVPIVIQKPSLAGVYYYSMALVIMGGLVLSTFLTTVLLPTTVCLTEDGFAWLARLPKRLAGARWRRRQPGVETP